MILNLLENRNVSRRLSKISMILPGLIVCVLIAMIGKYIGNYVPGIGGASLSIFIGNGSREYI